MCDRSSPPAPHLRRTTKQFLSVTCARIKTLISRPPLRWCSQRANDDDSRLWRARNHDSPTKAHPAQESMCSRPSSNHRQAPRRHSPSGSRRALGLIHDVTHHPPARQTSSSTPCALAEGRNGHATPEAPSVCRFVLTLQPCLPLPRPARERMPQCPQPACSRITPPCPKIFPVRDIIAPINPQSLPSDIVAKYPRPNAQASSSWFSNVRGCQRASPSSAPGPLPLDGCCQLFRSRGRSHKPARLLRGRLCMHGQGTSRDFRIIRVRLANFPRLANNCPLTLYSRPHAPPFDL